MKALRLTLTQPGLEPRAMSARYQAAVEMCAHIEERGFDLVNLEEHHGVHNGWSPSPLVLAGLIFGRCRRLPVSIAAFLLPLHDPIRVAEDIAVLDLASGGRLSVVLGVGYRPSEYAAHGKDWDRRGALMDECVATLLKAWTGEPFDHHGSTVQVSPKPLTQPHPLVMIGGSAKVSARRAARFGLPFSPAGHLPELEAYYYEQCRELGVKGMCLMPPPNTPMMFIHEDPDKAWATLGHHFLHEATTYSAWQTTDVRSALRSAATTVEQLRAEGIHQILTPEQALARGPDAVYCVHALCGGMPIEEGWKCLTLFTERVLPHLPRAAPDSGPSPS
ncbi:MULTISPECIES: LLM class flavin-dependent oxidoreductase [unclassified Pseudofrankia]|uniref:LLM class flavin-dependent oxidoreductase n=1 Tax=unclassified Pseudofrankia TaxID=2994372 RepID=UPI0008D8E617|nr:MULTISPECIES: LLM class flavin-dependent oxidoreductase [unclassified Pseudofrankia]MDT3439229.1 LLM class flavin-dependent oxidoreductase [Pseudofrankia sp. BMG5.37]OHV43816.1 luciferase [Pseudofrankia sp. BMG5.36]